MHVYQLPLPLVAQKAVIRILCRGIDPDESVRRQAHPLAYQMLQKHGKECPTRFRSCAPSRQENLCVQNSIQQAFDTGMELWSGYACTTRGAYWHLWNRDDDGFVYDCTYGARSIFFRYYGIRLDPHAAHDFVVNGRTHLAGLFLYWDLFLLAERSTHRRMGEAWTKEHFPRLVDDGFARIALV